MKLNLKDPLYIAVIILLLIVIFRGCGDNNTIITKPKNDTITIVKYIHIHDTIKGDTRIVYEKIDTSIWIKKAENKPDSTYKGLLNQYTSLGNQYFTKKGYKTTFPIDTIGSVTITDSVSENSLFSSTLLANLKYPVVTKTIKETLPPKNQLYIGGTLTGSPGVFINGVYGGLLFKNKKDKIYGAAIGWTGTFNYAGSMYWPIKFKK